MKNIVGSLDRGDDYRKILAYIGICGLSVGLMQLYQHYFENVTLPVELTRLYGKLYHMLFDKARNVELSCYENSDFYNRYTMAMDGAEEKLTAVVRGIFGAVIGAAGAALADGAAGLGHTEGAQEAGAQRPAHRLRSLRL